MSSSCIPPFSSASLESDVMSSLLFPRISSSSSSSWSSSTSSSYRSMGGRTFKKYLFLAVLTISLLGFFYQYNSPVCFSKPGLTEYVGPEVSLSALCIPFSVISFHLLSSPPFFSPSFPLQDDCLLLLLLDSHLLLLIPFLFASCVVFQLKREKVKLLFLALSTFSLFRCHFISSLFFFLPNDFLKRFVVANEDGKDYKFSYDRSTPLIFIGGMPRSGTTLLRVLLDAHPDIRCGEETRVVPRILGFRSQWMKAPVESRRLKEAGITSDVLDSAVAAFILEIIAKHGPPSKRLCNKDPFTLRSAVYLRQLFPGSKFIFMVRDGRAVVHSIISRKVCYSCFLFPKRTARFILWLHQRLEESHVHALYLAFFASNYVSCLI